MIWILLLLSTTSAFIPLTDIVLRKHLMDKLPDEVASISSSLSSTSEKPENLEEKKKPEAETSPCKPIEQISISRSEDDEENEEIPSNVFIKKRPVGESRSGKISASASPSSSSTSETTTLSSSLPSSSTSESFPLSENKKTLATSTSTEPSTEKTSTHASNMTSSTDTTIKTTTKMNIKNTTTATRPVPKCADNFARCIGIKKLCTKERYRYIMYNACAKTCGFCSDDIVMSRPTVCYDKTPEECASYRDTNFCHAYFHREPERVANCQKTCGFC